MGILFFFIALQYGYESVYLQILPLKTRSKIPTFVESFPKTGWHFIESSTKAFQKHVNCDNTKFRDKIAYVGGPFVEDRELSATATLLCTQHQDHQHPIAIMMMMTTKLEEISTEDLDIAKSSIAI